MDTEAREVGFYHVPTHMSDFQGDLLYNLPTKPFLSIEHWIHILHANIDFGIFAIGVRFEKRLEHDIMLQLKLLWRGIMERKQVLTSSEIVVVGKGCSIDPTAIIQGPTYIGDNVDIGPGVVIRNCVIGDDVTIDQGCQLMLSVIGNGTFLPFRAALYRTVVMDRCMVAQNACLQMCVVGRDSFIGAGNTFTDFLLVDKPLRSHFGGKLEETGMTALGSAIGHSVRIGSGFIFFPARMVESDVILFASDEERRVIENNIYYEDSDHLKLANGAKLHPQLYKREL
jgi:acetyltransferase-like isoleucine patch superfamily enzyme